MLIVAVRDRLSRSAACSISTLNSDSSDSIATAWTSGSGSVARTRIWS